jgi:hypothetical protein
VRSSSLQSRSIVFEIGAGLRVDLGERIIEHHHFRLTGHSTRNRHPLLLPRSGRAAAGSE